MKINLPSILAVAVAVAVTPFLGACTSSGGLAISRGSHGDYLTVARQTKSISTVDGRSVLDHPTDGSPRWATPGNAIASRD